MTLVSEKKEEASTNDPTKTSTSEVDTATVDELLKVDVETQKRLTRLLSKLHMSSNALGGRISESSTQRRTARRKGSEDTASHGSSQGVSTTAGGGGAATASNKPDKGKMYDVRGVHSRSGTDLCDCLNLQCPGCFFPCRRCGNTKCGPDCRSNRNFLYESWETNGVAGSLITNPLLNS